MPTKAKGLKPSQPFKQAMGNHNVRFKIKEKSQAPNRDSYHNYSVKTSTDKSGNVTKTRVKGPTHNVVRKTPNVRKGNC